MLFSRQPDYFSSDTATGIIQNSKTLDTSILKQYHVKPGDYPVVKYVVGRQIYYLNGKNNVLSKVGLDESKVQVIFDADYPEKAAIYKLPGYWIVLDEIVIFVIAYLLLCGIAIAVTGKNPVETGADPVVSRQMKYN